MDNYYAQTSFRVRDYSDTLKLLIPFKKLAGITRLANLTHLDYTGLPVYTAIRPNAKSLSTSQGKGLTKEAAQCSALMESIEVYFAEELVPDVIGKSEFELNQEKIPFIPVNHLAKSVRFTNPLQKFNWVRAELLFSGKTVLSSYAEFSLNSYLPDVLIYSPDTTGLASGNTYKEALLHGILEVIEREDVQVDTEVISLTSTLVNTISNSFEYAIYLQENNHGIPSFEVLLKSKNPFENQILFKGSGCHLNKTIALNRALTEAIQSRVTTIAGSRDDLMDTKYNSDASEFPVALNKKEFSNISDYPVMTIDEALSVLFEQIKKNNQDILVYTYYERELCIVKVKLIAVELINHV